MHSGLRVPASLLMLGLLMNAGCGPSRQDGAETSGTPGAAVNGQLIFALNDSSRVIIPGERAPDGMILRNGEEQLTLTPTETGCLTIPVFDGSLCLEGDTGLWTDAMRFGDAPYSVPVSWRRSAPSSRTAGTPSDTLHWRLTFGVDDPWYGDLHLFTASDGRATGTIETATGDFRFLHGHLTDGLLRLQTFDGAHLFLFTARVGADQTLEKGVFHSGTHYSTSFTGSPLRTDDPPLSEGRQAQWTGLEVGYSGIDAGGDSIAWHWNNQGDDIHVISVMGSWCPNCMDEHRMLLDLVKDRSDVIVHTLAFERGLDRPNGAETALRRLRTYASSMGLSDLSDRWRISLVGPASKTAAQERLPFLDKVVSFPTTVVLSPGHPEPWIHSGFNGPATGALHTLERAAFSSALSGPSGNH